MIPWCIKTGLIQKDNYMWDNFKEFLFAFVQMIDGNFKQLFV